MVQFQCKPELCDTLLTVAKRQLAEFCAEGPTDDEFQKAVLNLKKNIPEQRISNRYWMRQVRNIIEGYGDEDDGSDWDDSFTPEPPPRRRRRRNDSGNSQSDIEEGIGGCVDGIGGCVGVIFGLILLYQVVKHFAS